jgi:hypothetical protein
MTKTIRSRLWMAFLGMAAVWLGPAAARAQTAPAPEATPPAAAPAAEPAPAPPPPPPAPAATTANKGTVTIKGFVSATIFAQDATFSFGDGQNAEIPVPVAGGEKGDDPWFIDGDVRATRLNLTWDGPTGTALPKLGAMLEVDFFAGFAAGSFGNAAPIPRLRVATAQVALGDMTLKIGQDWAPLFGNVPVSLAHLAFPLGYGSAGSIGWRFPGIWLIVPLSPKEAAMQMKLTLAVLRNSWVLGAGMPADPQNAGSTGIPQVEARFDVATKMWSAYVVGHFDSKDLDTRGDDGVDSMTAFAIEAGFKLTSGPLLVQANGYFGQNIAHQFGNLVQFSSNPDNDISGFGVWGQVGYDVTPQISVFAFFGIDKPNEDDVRAAIAAAAFPKTQNIQAAGMVRWKAGPFALGLEYLFDQVTFDEAEAQGTTMTGSQIALSGFYAF